MVDAQRKDGAVSAKMAATHCCSDDGVFFIYSVP